MPDHTNLYNNETISIFDYRAGDIRPLVKTVYRAKKETSRRPRHKPLKDLESLTPWKDPSVSAFDLFHKPTEILQTNSWRMQKQYGPPIDVDRERVKKTRPRITLSPQSALDDIKEPFRHMFMEHIYSTTAVKAMDDALALASIKSVKAPLSEVYALSDPITTEPLLEPYMSPEWHTDGRSWNTNQLRYYNDLNKEFWPYLPNCAVCKADTARRSLKKIKRRH